MPYNDDSDQMMMMTNIIVKRNDDNVGQKMYWIHNKYVMIG